MKKIFDFIDECSDYSDMFHQTEGLNINEGFVTDFIKAAYKKISGNKKIQSSDAADKTADNIDDIKSDVLKQSFDTIKKASGDDFDEGNAMFLLSIIDYSYNQNKKLFGSLLSAANLNEQTLYVDAHNIILAMIMQNNEINKAINTVLNNYNGNSFDDMNKYIKDSYKKYGIIDNISYIIYIYLTIRYTLSLNEIKKQQPLPHILDYGKDSVEK